MLYWFCSFVSLNPWQDDFTVQLAKRADYLKVMVFFFSSLVGIHYIYLESKFFSKWLNFCRNWSENDRPGNTISLYYYISVILHQPKLLYNA